MAGDITVQLLVAKATRLGWQLPGGLVGQAAMAGDITGEISCCL